MSGRRPLLAGDLLAAVQGSLGPDDELEVLADRRSDPAGRGSQTPPVAERRRQPEVDRTLRQHGVVIVPAAGAEQPSSPTGTLLEDDSPTVPFGAFLHAGREDIGSLLDDTEPVDLLDDEPLPGHRRRRVVGRGRRWLVAGAVAAGALVLALLLRAGLSVPDLETVGAWAGFWPRPLASGEKELLPEPREPASAEAGRVAQPEIASPPGEAGGTGQVAEGRDDAGAGERHPPADGQRGVAEAPSEPAAPAPGLSRPGPPLEPARAEQPPPASPPPAQASPPADTPGAVSGSLRTDPGASDAAPLALPPRPRGLAESITPPVDAEIQGRAALVAPPAASGPPASSPRFPGLPRVELATTRPSVDPSQGVVHVARITDALGQPLVGAHVLLLGRMPAGIPVDTLLEPGAEPGTYLGIAPPGSEMASDVRVRVTLDRLRVEVPVAR